MCASSVRHRSRVGLFFFFEAAGRMHVHAQNTSGSRCFSLYLGRVLPAMLYHTLQRSLVVGGGARKFSFDERVFFVECRVSNAVILDQRRLCCRCLKQQGTWTSDAFSSPHSTRGFALILATPYIRSRGVLFFFCGLLPPTGRG